MEALKRFQAYLAHVFVLAVSNGVPRRSILVAMVVGTTLTLINQGTVVVAGGIPTWWKVLLTYIVPYVVSTYGAVSAMLRVEEAVANESANAKAVVVVHDVEAGETPIQVECGMKPPVVQFYENTTFVSPDELLSAVDTKNVHIYVDE